VYFGAETNDTTTGFAMTSAQVTPQMAKAITTQPTDTGACVYLGATPSGQQVPRNASSAMGRTAPGGSTLSRKAAAVAGPTMPSTFSPGVRR
jgi:hypothetical protein